METDDRFGRDVQVVIQRVHVELPQKRFLPRQLVRVSQEVLGLALLVLKRWSASRLILPDHELTSRADFSRSTTLSLFIFSPRSSFSVSTSCEACSIGSLYFVVPMISSRYSNRPSSCSFWALAFIWAIDSTSPYRTGVSFHSEKS